MSRTSRTSRTPKRKETLKKYDPVKFRNRDDPKIVKKLRRGHPMIPRKSLEDLSRDDLLDLYSTLRDSNVDYRRELKEITKKLAPQIAAELDVIYPNTKHTGWEGRRIYYRTLKEWFSRNAYRRKNIQQYINKLNEIGVENQDVCYGYVLSDLQYTTMKDLEQAELGALYSGRPRDAAALVPYMLKEFVESRTKNDLYRKVLSAKGIKTTKYLRFIRENEKKKYGKYLKRGKFVIPSNNKRRIRGTTRYYNRFEIFRANVKMWRAIGFDPKGKMRLLKWISLPSGETLPLDVSIDDKRSSAELIKDFIKENNLSYTPSQLDIEFCDFKYEVEALIENYVNSKGKLTFKIIKSKAYTPKGIARQSCPSYNLPSMKCLSKKERNIFLRSNSISRAFKYQSRYD
jgi:hypothetical protein